ncbi:Uncharacterised protein [Mycobacteroides abscessus subsp. abscessus]|nr:Uncharacterised protein [Mycobacteroides abscessus subsp. abscessus]SKU39808.1 Uncharacterised protein [Mycobacteroides abscessus subsp. abscessus]
MRADAARTAAISRGANTIIGATTRRPLALIGTVTATTSSSQPTPAGLRARIASARTAVTPSATYGSGRVPRLNGSQVASRNNAAKLRTRMLAATPGKAARSTPRVNTNQVAIANAVLGPRSQNGATLTPVSGASSCWLNANGASAAFHHR